MSLQSEDNILPFYANVYAQALRYSIVIIPSSSISPMIGILHHDVSPQTQELIDTALVTKFREKGVISK